jgi:uncharacterized membrane protein YfcA
MHLYLPIAEVSMDITLLLGMGAAIGFLSGLFGVGGGFLVTPLLIFFGVSPAVAAATAANTVISPSVSGALSHWRRGTLDVRMGLLLLAGGLVGGAASVWLFGVLRRLGQIDVTVSLAYVILLGVVGSLMLKDVLKSTRWWNRGQPAQRGRLHQHYWVHGLPLKMRFPKSRLYISAILPFGVGAVVGILAGIMGVGGGFIMVPAMIYLIGMPTKVVVGTSVFQFLFVTGFTAVLHAVQNGTVDVLLALVLLVGGVIGAQVGVVLATRLRAEQLRILLALLVVGVCLKLFADLVLRPEDLYSLGAS